MVGGVRSGAPTRGARSGAFTGGARSGALSSSTSLVRSSSIIIFGSVFLLFKFQFNIFSGGG